MLDRSLICDVPAFAGLSPEGLDEVVAHARALRLPKGIAAFVEGRPAENCFLLLAGKTRVTRAMAKGQPAVVRFAGPGDMLADAFTINSENYLGTATAIVDSLTLVWSNSSWKHLLMRRPRLAINAMKALDERLREAEARFQEISTQQCERRVANAVLRLSRQAGRCVEAGVMIGFPVSRQDIADLAGTTIHTASRILSSWCQQGLVDSGRQRIFLRDPLRLAMQAKSTDQYSPQRKKRARSSERSAHAEVGMSAS